MTPILFLELELSHGKSVEAGEYCSKISSPRKAATPKGLALENWAEGCYNVDSDGKNEKKLFLSSSPLVGKPRHPSVLLSRVAEIAIVLARTEIS